MNLDLVRTEFSNKSTIGKLAIDGVFECYTLEDVIRPDGIKVPGATAIPCGKYEVVITFSNRFKCPLPLILNVPNFSGVRIHPGNDDGDTEGCVLVGQVKQVDRIGQSRAAFGLFFPKLEAALRNSRVFIEVSNAAGDVNTALASQSA